MANKPVKPNKGYKSTTADVVYTKEHTVNIILEHFKPQGFVLDPSMGDGAFYNKMNEPKEWCEIDKGRDFFEWSEKVDWIVTNPPFSIFDVFLEHCLEVSDNVVLLVPLTKVFKSVKIDKMIHKYGGIKEILHLGSGGQHGFPFGFPVGCIHYQKNYKGPINYTQKYAKIHCKKVKKVEE